ncbi:MAG: helix-turn-helix transcriptional regulator [Deltaproteobacteria bacterium]|nr:helix-turn-helix transcriptional regulator [Deltaproteobacteria bacterium]
MSNVVKVLKAEIARISKREAKSATQGIGKSTTWLRKVVADLKRRVVLLEKENKRLSSAMKKYQVEQLQKPDEETKKARLTSKGIRSLRNKLGLSQAGFAKLVGVTTHAVYLWENKEGALSLRDKTKAALLLIRGLGARQAKEKLAEAETKNRGVRASAHRTKKAR